MAVPRKISVFAAPSRRTCREWRVASSGRCLLVGHGHREATQAQCRRADHCRVQRPPEAPRRRGNTSPDPSRRRPRCATGARASGGPESRPRPRSQSSERARGPLDGYQLTSEQVRTARGARWTCSRLAPLLVQPRLQKDRRSHCVDPDPVVPSGARLGSAPLPPSWAASLASAASPRDRTASAGGERPRRSSGAHHAARPERRARFAARQPRPSPPGPRGPSGPRATEEARPRRGRRRAPRPRAATAR